MQPFRSDEVTDSEEVDALSVSFDTGGIKLEEDAAENTALLKHEGMQDCPSATVVEGISTAVQTGASTTEGSRNAVNVQNREFEQAELTAVVWSRCHRYRNDATPESRLDRCASVAKIHAHFFSDREVYREKITTLTELSGTIGKWQEDVIDSASNITDNRRQFLAEITSLESEIANEDRKIPNQWLYDSLRENLGNFEAATVADYLAFYLFTSAETEWKRTMCLALFSITTVTSDGMLDCVGRIEMAESWNGILPFKAATRDSIEEAHDFFFDAIDRLHSFCSPVEVFSSKFITEVIGFQYTLRDALYHPEILSACMHFHVNWYNWASCNGVNFSYSDIDATFLEVNRTLQVGTKRSSGIPGKRLCSQPQGGSQANVSTAKQSTYNASTNILSNSKNARIHEAPPKSLLRRVIPIALSCALLTVFLSSFSAYISQRTRDLEAIPPGSLGTLDTMLVSASQSRTASLFVAQVNPKLWPTMTWDNRLKLTKEVMGIAKSQNLQTVLLYSEGIVVSQVIAGKLRYLEKPSATKHGS